MLDIRTYESEKKGTRVDILRKYRHRNDAGKAISTYKQLGFFYLSDGYNSELRSLLDDDEIYQLDNWLSETSFAQSSGTTIDDIEKVVLRMPSALLESVKKLFLEAKRLDLSFLPNQVMLKSLLETAHILKKEIDEKNGFICDIPLTSDHCKTEKTVSHKNDMQALADGRLLFKTILELPQPLGKTCDELEKIAAENYGKSKKIPPPQVREWAGDMLNRQQNKPIKLWCYAVAIDMLLQHGINPCSFMPPERIAGYWLVQKKEYLSLEEAQKLFATIFSIELTSDIVNSIKTIYLV